MTQERVQEIQEHFERMFIEGVTPWTEHGMEPEIPALADRLLREGAEAHVLDIGCGNGWVSSYFASRGLRVSGIDSSPTAIAAAKQQAQAAAVDGRVEFTVGDGLHLPYEDAEFDAVFDRGFFHHVPEDEYAQYLREVTRVLKPGGLLSLHAFTPQNHPQIGHRFTRDDITRIFGSLFTLLEHREDPFPTDAPAHLGHYLLQKK